MNLCSSQGSLSPGKQCGFSKALQQVSDQVTLRTQALDSPAVPSSGLGIFSLTTSSGTLDPS